MRVFVLGHRGMLGHVVAGLLEQKGFEVVTSTRRYAAEPGAALVEEVRASGAAWVVNAAGLIKQKSVDEHALFEVNTLLPLQLRASLAPGQRLIHASTDCVFSGSRGCYEVDAPTDAEDVYGLSKLLGESIIPDPRCTVIRTSIIGPERAGGHGLMGWFLSQTGTVSGYEDHWWNGITTLEWAKICLRVMDGELEGAGKLLQPGAAAAVSKAEMLELIAEAWGHPVEVRRVRTGAPVDRTLVPTVPAADLRTQLLEMREWYGARFAADEVGA